MTQTSPFKEYNLDLSICKKSNKVVKKICTSKHTFYYLLNYDAKYLTYDNLEAATYRSVVFSFPEKKPLCFSPPRSISMESFQLRNPYPSMDDIWINEVIEGVMINLFYDPRIQRWEIATKSSIGGQYWFYSVKTVSSKKTFYKMFLEAFSAGENQELNDLPFLEYFPKWACFSFVLQHPENPRLIPVIKPVVYMVAMYHIENQVVEYIPPTIYESMNIFQNLEGVIAFPRQYKIETYDPREFLLFPLVTKVTEGAKAGLMFLNIDTGERAKWVNPVYSSIQRMKHIDPFPQYLYFCMRRVESTLSKSTLSKPPLSKEEETSKESNVGQFCFEEYPVWKKPMRKIDEEFRHFVDCVYEAYADIYILKNKRGGLLEKHVLHARKIHFEVFLPRSKIARKEKRIYSFWINRREVTAYFDRMEPRELLFLMNEDRRNDDPNIWKTMA